MTRLTDRVVDRAIDRGLLPDALLRRAIRGLLSRRRERIGAGDSAEAQAATRRLLASLRHQPITVQAPAANKQHYEVPTELFELMLGERLKYSCGWWPEGVTHLDDAEEAMLALTCERAGLANGQEILELGCGWGSLTLWMAQRYPASRMTAVSNSSTQREFIAKRAAERGLDNVRIVTCDVADFDLPTHAALEPGSVDRVVSVEMFEHVRNHRELMRRVAGWLAPDGALFVHVFAHATTPYLFGSGERADWMARHFFTGGMMPSRDWLLQHQENLVLDDHWVVGGEHYARTCETWLDRLDAGRDRVLDLFADTYGAADAEAWFNRWRVFNLACAELFAYDEGREWFVSHYRFTKPDLRSRPAR